MTNFKWSHDGVVDQDTGIELIDLFSEERLNKLGHDEDWRENWKFNFYDPGFLCLGRKISFAFDAKRLGREIAVHLNGKTFTGNQWFGYEVSSEYIEGALSEFGISDKDKIEYVMNFISNSLVFSLSPVKETFVYFIPTLNMRREAPPSIIRNIK